MWKCEGCGACCKFFSLSAKDISRELLAYFKMHGCGYKDGKIIIPARCKYLTEGNRCKINDRKPEVCKIAGEEECKRARRLYEEIEKKR